MLISEEQDIQQCHHDNESNHTLAVLQHTAQQKVVFNYRNVCRHKVCIDKSTNELKTFCKLSNGSVQRTKTVVYHTCKLTTSRVENTYQIRQFVIHIVLFECVALR